MDNENTENEENEEDDRAYFYLAIAALLCIPIFLVMFSSAISTSYINNTINKSFIFNTNNGIIIINSTFLNPILNTSNLDVLYTSVRIDSALETFPNGSIINISKEYALQEMKTNLCENGYYLISISYTNNFWNCSQ
jgi:hypothetical protein